jgi:hypothetical protein
MSVSVVAQLATQAALYVGGLEKVSSCYSCNSQVVKGTYRP